MVGEKEQQVEPLDQSPTPVLVSASYVALDGSLNISRPQCSCKTGEIILALLTC